LREQVVPVNQTDTVSPEQEATEAAVAGALGKRWRLVRPLGEGGQSRVWLANDLELQQLVAIKLLSGCHSQDGLVRMRREVKLGRSLNHPSIVRTHELIETQAGRALVMDWLPGGSVAERLASGPFSIDQVVRLAASVLSALAALHRNAIVHRDIKPANLLLDAEDNVYVADLGLARQLSGSDLTQTQGGAGTPLYMSPEQIRNDPLTPATDLYSLGATLYHLITGAPPFSGCSAFELAAHHMNGSVEAIRHRRPDCPRWLATFVMRLLEGAPGDRWPDAELALRAFRRKRSGYSPRVIRRLLLVSVAAALLVGAAAMLLGRSSRRPASSFATEGQVVRGLDDGGHELWQHRCRHPIQQALEADLDHDGKAEMLISAFPRGESIRGKDDYRSEVLAIDRRGRVLTTFRPETQAGEVREGQPPLFFMPILSSIDLDGDEIPEVVANCRHRGLAPTTLFIYWTRHDLWEQALAHDGWIFDIRPVPGYSTPHLRFIAFSNTLSSLPSIAELELLPPDADGRPADTWRSPAAIAGSRPAVWAGYHWYTVLEQAPPGQLDIGGNDGIDAQGSSRFSMAGQRVVIDRWGNPVPGPNAGRDLASPRTRFLKRIAALGDYRAQASPGNTASSIAEIEATFAPLLQEAPSRAVLAQAAGRALAKAGDLEAGIAVVAESWRTLKYDALGYTLGHLQAIAGDLDAASRTLRTTIGRCKTPTGGHLANRLLIRVALEQHDPVLLQTAIDSMGVDKSPSTGPVVARAHLWWDQVDIRDCTLESRDVTPDAEAIACLARWRLGRITEADLVAMDRSLQENPDAAYDIRLARAAVLLALGRSSEALDVSSHLMAELKTRACSDFSILQTLNLTAAVRLKALARLGRRDAVLEGAGQLQPSLRPGLLPLIIVNEAVAGSEP